MQPSIRSFNEWMEEDPVHRQSSWLVVGKGPSFKQMNRLDSTGLLRLGLNHVVRETRVDVFHCIDLEVVEQCGDTIIENAAVAVLPWAPHERRRLLSWSRYEEFLPSGLSLEEHLEHSPVLRRLADQDRLLWYNLRTAPKRLRRSGMPITPVRGFSASAAVALLAQNGVTRIRTLGIDGGRRYAGEFRDLNKKTLLAAGQASFDSQFEALSSLIYTAGLDFGPLDQPLPARVLIAVDAREQVPARVLAHALRRHASLSLDIAQVLSPYGKGEHVQPLEKDSRAIQIAASCLVERDLREVWDQGNSLVSTSMTCWPAPGPRPWLHTDADDAWRWCSALIDAVDDGTITRQEVVQAVDTGDLRASLLVQLDRRLRDPILLPRHLWVRDRFIGVGSGPINRLGRHRQLGAAIARYLGELVAWRKWGRYPIIILDKLGKVLRGLF